MNVLPPGRLRAGLFQALQRQGLKREVAVSVTHFLAVPEMVAVTDYCATLPRLICRHLAHDPRLKILPAPVDLGTFPVEMAWHVRYRQDPGPPLAAVPDRRRGERCREGPVVTLSSDAPAEEVKVGSGPRCGQLAPVASAGSHGRDEGEGRTLARNRGRNDAPSQNCRLVDRGTGHGEFRPRPAATARSW